MRGEAVDLFIAGPPCEGHSNLNNHTRRADPRNKLYVTAIALGVALRSRAILIENVPAVQLDRSGVVEDAVRLLRSSGYSVARRVLRADELGAPQRRQRFFLVAWLDGKLEEHDPLSEAASVLAAPAAPVAWAIADLIDQPPTTILDKPPAVSEENQRRIDYLFANDLYDLPDAERPDCHKNGTSYRAVYGRMHWDRPAQTITTGFNASGQGRNIHPLRRRVITPREAARLQGFPDWFEFGPAGLDIKRKHLAKWIGDAVHPVLGYAAGLAALTASSLAAEVNNEVKDAALTSTTGRRAD
jgi:DNA (cytosine-5)-methyltransferase 1